LQDDLIELSDPQAEFLESTCKHSGFVAGLGSGKTFIGVLKTLLKIINDDIPKVAYYLPTYPDIRDIAFDMFPAVCEELGYDYKLNKSDKEFFVIDDGERIGKVMLRNMSEPEGIVGYQVGYSLIDETDILPQEKMDKAYKKILARNRLIVPVENDDVLAEYEETEELPAGTYWHKERQELCWINCIDVAGTPEGFKWFYKRFKKEFKEGRDKLIVASTYSNLHNLPDDYIETLEAQYPPNLIEAYINGRFINLTSGSIYTYFDRNKHNTAREVKDTDTLHVGQDFNVGGCISTVHVIEGDKAYRVNEHSSKDTYGIIDTLEKYYPDNKIIIYPDASGDSGKTNATKSDIALLQEAGYSTNYPKANGRVADRVASYNGLLSHDRYFVNVANCPHGTEALEQQAYDKNGEPEKFNGGGTIDDYNDSSGYFVVRMFPIVSYGKISVGWNR
jgi:hypothetical protein